MKTGRKISGGKYHARRKKRLHERSGVQIKTTLGDSKKKTLRVRGGNIKQRLLRTNIANLLIGKKAEKAEIKNVLETPQNVFFARQNILFKGSVIETSKGKAKITNRPTQEGFVNAVLVE
jgi:small subunit ribosomal protein S8e